MTRNTTALLAAFLWTAAATAQSPVPAAMSAPWAQAMCAAWNAEPTLTAKLVESGWIPTRCR